MAGIVAVVIAILTALGTEAKGVRFGTGHSPGDQNRLGISPAT